jgi:hypothetical protein
MIFCSYKIGGLAVGRSIEIWKTSDLNGNEPFLFSDSVPTGYENISSVENIYKFGNLTKLDFKKVRDEMKQTVLDLGSLKTLSTETDPDSLTPNADDAFLIGSGAVGDWVNKDGQIAKFDGSVWVYFGNSGISSAVESLGFSYLNPIESKIAAGYLIGSIPQQIAAYNYDAEEKENDQFLYKIYVQDCRKKRFKWAENHFLQQIPANTAEVLSVIETDFLNSRYYEHGLDGMFEFGDIAEGLSDYIDGTPGTKFENNGIRQKNWITLFGSNMSTFCDELKDKLFYNGINSE